MFRSPLCSPPPLPLLLLLSLLSDAALAACRKKQRRKKKRYYTIRRASCTDPQTELVLSRCQRRYAFNTFRLQPLSPPFCRMMSNVSVEKMLLILQASFPSFFVFKGPTVCVCVCCSNGGSLLERY